MSWGRATLAAQCLAAGGRDLGGLWLRARTGPARDAFVAALPPHTRIHPDSLPDVLFGGLDLAETLAMGHAVYRKGALARANLILLSGAERCSPAFAARLGQYLDAGGAPIIALDESDGDDVPRSGLVERLGLFATLDDVALSDLSVIDLPLTPDAGPVAVAPGIVGAITVTAATLGIVSLRAPRFAVAAARALARSEGQTDVTEDHARRAVDLTLAHRAVALPETDPDFAPPPTEPDPPPQTENAGGSAGISDRLVEAARAALPPGLLTALAAAQGGAQTGGGAGAPKVNGGRGRPLPARPGSASRGQIDTVATLRSAAPWQAIRRRARPDDPRPILIEASDIRLRRFQQKTQRLVIFVIDASGSAAMARLAEAKGAIELLLSDAYAARDHVAVVGFRGEGARCLLPPTGSLTRAKRALAGLPGGGGTPLAAGLDMGLDLAMQARRGSRMPSLVLLTDGRSNIARNGQADRARAVTDAEESCVRIARSGVPLLTVDTGIRPNRTLRTLNDAANGRYIALPRAGASSLADAVSS